MNLVIPNSFIFILDSTTSLEIMAAKILTSTSLMTMIKAFSVLVLSRLEFYAKGI